MKSLVPITLVALSCGFGTVASAAPATLQASQEAKQVYDESADGATQVAEALVRAKRNHRRVLIQWGANWCGWCIKLDKLFQSDAKINHELRYEYDLVHIDIGRFDKQADLLERYELELKGVPHLTILDEDGKLVAHVNTEPLEAKREDGKLGHDSAKVLAMLEKYRAPQTQGRSLLRARIDEARNLEKRVFLIFGAPW